MLVVWVLHVWLVNGDSRESNQSIESSLFSPLNIMGWEKWEMNQS
jgi:hypothetical protein